MQFKRKALLTIFENGGRMGNPRYTEDSQTTDSQNVLDGQSQVLLDDDHAGWRGEDETWREREGRNELKHVAGLGEL